MKFFGIVFFLRAGIFLRALAQIGVVLKDRFLGVILSRPVSQRIFVHHRGLLSAIFICVLLQGCIDSTSRDEAYSLSNHIIERLDSLGVQDYFPEKHFPRDVMVQMLAEMRERCDYRNRKGGFVNDFYARNIGMNPDRVSFIYEYFLRCDSIRIILTYEIEQKPELVRFTIEPLEVENIMLDRSR